MPTLAKSKLLLPALVLVALLAVPAAAQATLTYVKVGMDIGFNPPFYPLGIAVANDDGSEARLIAKRATNPCISPDGLSVAFLHEGAKHSQELQVVLAAGGPARTLMVGLREPFYVVWSPDSATIAALRGPELGKRKLVLIDVATGAQRVLAQGFFSGFSFSPDSSKLVYSRAGSEKYPPRSDVFRVSTSGGKPVRLTNDHRSLDPLWGSNDRIVFVKQIDANKRKYGPKNELYLMNPTGKGVKRLTHTKVPELLQGLFPTDWSASGNQLLAEFEGQDTSYAVKVNPKTGAQKPVGKVGEQGFVGTALSNDGKFVLGFEGGFDPGNSHDVVRIPYAGGKAKVLVKNAFEPDWSF